MSFFSLLAKLLLGIIILPIYLVFMIIFLVFWLIFTITGIGPIIQCCRNRKDRHILNEYIDTSVNSSVPSTSLISISSSHPIQMITVGNSNRRLAVRWSPGTNPSLPPVAIPNGLGATMMTISPVHEQLANLGFPVLSYDRAGVGMSDPLPKGVHHFNAEETIDEMHYVLTHPVINHANSKWILIGPSMGNIVAQSYVAKYPQMVDGILNMDGFPFPFSGVRSAFTKAAIVYDIYASIIWTGALRPFLYFASKTAFFQRLISKTFSRSAILAQMNQRNFYKSLAQEMITMMDLADYTRKAWGKAYDLTVMDRADLEPLVNSRPFACGDAPNGVFTSLPRSKYEHGNDWCDPRLTEQAIEKMEKNSTEQDILPNIWKNLVVRVMSARSYHSGIHYFYRPNMQDWAAAEHSLHALAAKDGARTVFPIRHHGQMFFYATEYIVQQTVEIARVLAKLNNKEFTLDNNNNKQESSTVTAVDVAV